VTFEPTERQKEAITTIHCPVAVVAGAGSGKTRVLVERYLYLLDQGFSVEEIAAITFTKKAAQEMKERLLEARPELTARLEQAQISTIDSCASALCRSIRSRPELTPGSGWQKSGRPDCCWPRSLRKWCGCAAPR